MKEVVASKSVVGRLRCFFGVCTSINMRERFMSVIQLKAAALKYLQVRLATSTQAFFC